MNSEEQAIREIHARTVGNRSGLTRDERHIGALIIALDAERERSRKLLESIDWCLRECRVYAAHHPLEPLAQRLFDSLLFARAAYEMKETKPGDAR